LPTHGSIARPLGAAFMLLAAVCYWGALSDSLTTPTRVTVESRPRVRRPSYGPETFCSSQRICRSRSCV
jgi:hypothetical protein